MADIRFTELAIAERLDLSAIVAIVMNQNGELVSLKCSVSQIAEFIVNGIEFQGLTSDDKKIIGAINELIAKVDDLELFKFPNATIIGTPTINNGQISGFSQTSYLQFPFLMDFQGRHFAINMEFTTAADVTNQQNIFDSDFGLAFAIRSAKFVIAVSSNGTSWNIGEGVGSHTVLPNTTYRVQLSWNGTAYKLSYSLNGGESYTEDISLASTESPFAKQVYIGVGENYASVLNFFKGIINLNYASLYVADSLVWQGMDDVGLASRLATDLSNIDAAGEQRIKDIAGGGGGGDVTKAYVDQQDEALQTQIDDEKAEIQKLDNRVDVLEKQAKGILYDFVSQTVEGTQNIPKGSHLADIQKLEGKSIVWNQKLTIRNSQTIEGITLTSNGDGSYTVSGTANTTVWLNIGTFTTVVGHTYYLKGCPKGGSTSTYRIYNDNGGLYDIGDGSLAVATAEKRIYISLLGGTTADNLVFKPQLFDLTQMFGAGNEPTIEQFESMFPNDYYPYSEPTLQSVDNSKFVVKGKNLLKRTNDNLWYYAKGYDDIVITDSGYKSNRPSLVGFIIPVKPNTTYTYSANSNVSNQWRVYGFDNQPSSNESIENADTLLNITLKDINQTFTTKSNTHWVVVGAYESVIGEIFDMQLELGSNATTYSPYTIPTDYPLVFVGKSAGTVRDELDLVNKKYIQRIGIVDLGTLYWNYDTVNYIYTSSNTSFKTKNCITNLKYEQTQIVGVANMTDKTWHIRPTDAGYDGKLYIKDLSITSPEGMSRNLDGVMFYYELSEPIITDISEVIDSFEVEGNGSIEFDSSIPVKNTIEYLRYLNEV